VGGSGQHGAADHDDVVGGFVAKLGAEPMIMSPAQFDSFRKEEYSVLGEVMRASGVKAQ